MMNEEDLVRVGVIGCGYWGPNLMRNFGAMEGCELRAICDRDANRLGSIHRRFPLATAHTEFGDLLDDPNVDAVSICTPVHSHYQLASAALEAGKHVLLEKPLTHSVETAIKLVEAAAARERILMVDHTFVYSGPVQRIKSIIDRGDIGQLLYFDSVRINLGLFQSDINVVWDLAPHDLSIMDCFLASEPKWISAIGSSHFGKIENIAYLTVGFEDSLIAHFHVNWLAPVKIRSTVIGGTKRMIVYDDLAPSEKVLVYDKGVSLNGESKKRHEVLIDYRMGDMFAPHLDKTEPLLNVCKHFIESIRSGTPPLTDGEAGLRVVRLLEAAQRSMDRRGERIELCLEPAR